MDLLIQDIRKRCRMQMDGIASGSMRKKGLDYKLNFGVSIPQIKGLAKRYRPNAQLAETLWNDNTRELKILATMLYPIEEYNNDVAHLWVSQIPNQEIREQLVFNLLQKLDDAFVLALLWVKDEAQDVRATGYWLLARLISSQKTVYNLDLNFFPYIWDDVLSVNVSLRNAAILFLKNAGRLSSFLAETILGKLAFLQSSENEVHKEVYDTLAFEYDYLYNSK